MTRLRTVLVASLVAIAALAFEWSENRRFEMTVVRVADGDTLEARGSAGALHRIRLAEIDAPELDQPHGRKARAALDDLVDGRQITVEQLDQDRYGRIVGRVTTGDLEVNATLVERGHAWVYRKYNRRKVLEDLEVDAKRARKGLWAASGPVAPWDWRKGVRATSAPAAAAEGPIYGNQKSGIYHRPDCPDYAKISHRNRVPFETSAAAESAGYRVAGNCP